MGNARSFALQIDADFGQMTQELREDVGEIAKIALTSIVRRTPVKLGRARGSWRVTIGIIETRNIETLDVDGSITISNGSEVIDTFINSNSWRPIIIQSNIPYIGRLEDGYSLQAPSGMVALTLVELESALS